jgi:hypothetical protein
MRPPLFLIPLFPLLGFLFNITIGVRVLTRRPSDHHDGHAHATTSPIVGLVACGAVLLSFLVAGSAGAIFSTRSRP